MKQYISTAKQAFSLLTLQKSDDNNQPTSLLAQQCVPIVAMLLGLSYYITAEVILFLSGGASIRSGLLAAIIITIADADLDRGQKLASLSWTGQLLEAWQNKNYEESDITKHYSLMLLNLSLIVKVAALTMLISTAQTSWLMLPVIFASASLLSSGSAAKIFQANENIYLPWIIAAIASIPCILISQSLVPVILIGFITFALSQALTKLAHKSFNTINRQLALCLTELSFIITLLASLLLSR